MAGHVRRKLKFNSSGSFSSLEIRFRPEADNQLSPILEMPAGSIHGADYSDSTKTAKGLVTTICSCFSNSFSLALRSCSDI